MNDNQKAWRAIRETDHLLPIDTLPYPIGHFSGPGDLSLSGNVGDKALFEYIGTRAWAAHSSSEPRQLEPIINRRLFDGIRSALSSLIDIEEGAMGSPASMTTAEEFDQFGTQWWIPETPSDQHFFSYRSRDAQWGGFRFRDMSFRFVRANLVGFAIDVVFPAKGGGGFDIAVVSAVPDTGQAKEESQRNAYAWFRLDIEFSTEVAFALLATMLRLSNFFGVALNCRQTADV